MVMIYTSYGSKFKQIDQESILTSAERAGLSFPYSCRDGRCSSCKCKVLSGETESLGEEFGLTAHQKSQNWILSCLRLAKTDVKLELENLGNFPMIPPKTLPTKINSVTQISKNLMTVVLRVPPSSKLEYYAGQYVEIIVGNLRRSYSIANCPNIDNCLEFLIQKIDKGAMSDYWFKQAKVNDTLRIVGPHGTFFLRDIVGKDLVFLATGTGIAPVKAILEALNNKPKNKHPDSVTIYWGGRTPVDLYWNLPGYKYPAHLEPVLSRTLDSWAGSVGYVQDTFLSMSPDLTKTVVYASGSGKMIRSASERLFEKGLDEAQFFSDAFVASGLIK